MSIDRLKAAIEENSLTTEESLSAQRAGFWMQIHNLAWKRITNDSRGDVVIDGDVAWTKAFIQECEQIKKTFWDKLRKKEIEGVIFGPGQQEYVARGERTSGYLLWGMQPNVPVREEAMKRVGSDAEIEMLGSSLALIKKGIPQYIQSQNDSYFPNINSIASLQETVTSIENGINRIFAGITKASLKSNDPGLNVIYELEQFWKEQVGFASIEGEKTIYSLQTHQKHPQALIVIIPPDNRLMQEKPAQFNVDTSHELNLLYIKPFECTELWYGLAGLHELVHLHDFATGKESKRPNRSEYIEGEFRAFSAEITAANLLTNNEFSRVIRNFVDHQKFTMEDIDRLGKDPESKIIDNLGSTVDSHLRMPRPKSWTEANTRAGLYFMASAFSVAEKFAAEGQDISNLRKNVIETHYEKFGLLPKK